MLAIRSIFTTKVALAAVGCSRHRCDGALAVGVSHHVLGRHALSLNRRRGWHCPSLVGHNTAHRHVVGGGSVLCPAAPVMGSRSLLIGSHTRKSPRLLVQEGRVLRLSDRKCLSCRGSRDDIPLFDVESDQRSCRNDPIVSVKSLTGQSNEILEKQGDARKVCGRPDVDRDL